jgi:hypothetical protein
MDDAVVTNAQVSTSDSAEYVWTIVTLRLTPAACEGISFHSTTAGLRLCRLSDIATTAGVLPGDLLIQVNNKEVSSYPLHELQAMFQQ